VEVGDSRWFLIWCVRPRRKHVKGFGRSSSLKTSWDGYGFVGPPPLGPSRAQHSRAQRGANHGGAHRCAGELSPRQRVLPAGRIVWMMRRMTVRTGLDGRRPQRDAMKIYDVLLGACLVPPLLLHTTVASPRALPEDPVWARPPCMARGEGAASSPADSSAAS